MYDRQPRLPVDLVLGVQVGIGVEEKDYFTHMKGLKIGLLRNIDWLPPMLRDSSIVRDSYNSRRRLTNVVFETDDRVPLQEVGFQGPHKVANKWTNQMYVVWHQP